jgi:Cu/Ag efflux pump CusA
VKNLLLLLESSINPTPEHVARLAVNEDDSLLDIMIRAGKVNDKTTSVGHEEIKALVELVERGHLASTEWAFRVASKQLTEELASSFYKALAVVPEKTSAWRNDVAIQAFGNLINLSPDDAWEILQSTKDDSNQQQLLLLAMLQVSNDVVVEEATKLRRIGLNKADVMTLLLIARDANQLQKEDQKHLGIIAAGGGHLSPAFETQAAWLYLKRIGLSEQALAAVGTQ